MTQRAGSSSDNGHGETQVVDFNSVREKRLEEKRKNNERIFFRDLLSVYSVNDQKQLIPIDLVDISEEGCAFQVPHNPEKPWPTDGNGIPLRFYFSRDMYLEVLVQVQNSSHSIEKHKRYLRFGCSVDKGIQSYPAYQQFVKFLKLYSQHAHRDRGHVTEFYP